MEFKPQDSSLQAARAAVHQALAGRQKLLCFGDRLALISIAYLDAIADGLKAACTTADEALALLRQNAVDVVLVTEDLEQGYGIDLVRQVRQLQPDCLCMLFLRRETQVVVREALDAGAHAVMFVSSLGTGRGDFMQALTSMADGGIYVPEDIRRAAAFTHADGQRDSHLLDHLSTRELEVLNALSCGFSNREIAGQLFISQETVKSHVSTIISKLGVRDRTQAAVTAMRLGVVDPALLQA